ncbi:hypothetical protein, partial [uncultured Imperialibacter sp.]|uniref:hypothetical protein n=1 Tax=uncultured Imperialibacter sp. TaxID=1672639 RepID=UPI0030DBC54C
MLLKKLLFYQNSFLFLILWIVVGCSRTMSVKSRLLDKPLPTSFVIVSATSTFLRPNSERLFIYDRLYLSDTVELVDGHLIATDNQGGYFEFEGDTIFRVSEFIKQTPVIGYRTNLGGSIEQFYSTSEPFLTQETGAIMDGPLDQGIKFIFPPSSSADYNLNQTTCLKWASTNGERVDSVNFQVEIKSIFDEVIGNFKVVGETFEFDPKNYQEHVVIIEVHGLKDEEISTKPLGIKFYGSTFR